MRLTRPLIILLASCAWLGLWGCEAVANLDDVKMAEQGGSAGFAGSELEAGNADAPSDGQAADASAAADAADAADEPDVAVGQETGDANDAPDAPAVDAEDAGPLSFPATCVKPGSVGIQCNPMTNAGCSPGTACDMAANGGQYGFVCFPDGTVAEGDPCNGVSGPWCNATLHCGTTKCSKFCCTSDDCGGSTPQCGMYDPGKVGTFGWCI